MKGCDCSEKVQCIKNEEYIYSRRLKWIICVSMDEIWISKEEETSPTTWEDRIKESLFGFIWRLCKEQK